MKITIKKSLQGLLLVPALALGVSVVAPAVPAAYAQLDDGINAAKTDDQVDADMATIVANVVNVLLFIIGALSVIMIIFGGFKYITSGGDSSGVTAAKNTIMYAVIGLIVAVLAYAIVNFVLGEGDSLFTN
jgi:hypothetical protein